jgi:hypothetical protein
LRACIQRLVAQLLGLALASIEQLTRRDGITEADLDVGFE